MRVAGALLSMVACLLGIKVTLSKNMCVYLATHYFVPQVAFEKSALSGDQDGSKFTSILIFVSMGTPPLSKVRNVHRCNA